MGIPRGRRISYIDWMRGLACLLMFQTHCYGSWLSAAARKSHFFGWSQLVGTLPAPLFLFLAGISFALVTNRMRQKGIGAGQIARTTIRRGAEIFALGLLFRVQEFALGYGYAPWTDLLRVDILNVIGISIMLMGVLCWVARRQPANAISAAVVAGGIALLTPPLWTSWQPRWLPWPFESYINGVHNLGAPQHWLFPIFPWTAFAFAGLAVGFFVLSGWARAREAKAAAVLGGGGAILFFAGRWFDSLPVKMYAVYDFWHTSPNFFLIRTGVVLVIAFLAYAWCRWGAALKGFSPVLEMGRTSLFVYWLHIEFVYGRFSILRKGAQSIAAATAGILTICAAMTIVAAVRNRTKGRGVQALAFWRKPVGIPA